MTRDEVLRKVKKLLTRGNRTPYKNEAEICLAAARRLMDEYDIKMNSIESFELDAEWTREPIFEGVRLSSLATHVAGLVQEFFHVRMVFVEQKGLKSGRIVTVGKRIDAFGRAHHAAIAKYVFVYCIRTFKALWLAYKHEHGLTQAEAHSYYLGLVVGLGERLESERKHSTVAELGALVRVDHSLRNALRSRYPEMTVQDCTSRAVVNAEVVADGMKRGKSISIRTPLADQSTPGTPPRQLEPHDPEAVSG